VATRFGRRPIGPHVNGSIVNGIRQTTKAAIVKSAQELIEEKSAITEKRP
jgi:hypothetical protein